ncbi:hypothetical protein LCL86_01445 [Muricauda ruestringensis]|uniref:hypothetical protein n=1 Tax=Flagellimonas ruestringensis TaxID=111501 RepID=UPI001CD3B01A|nr:hypothetical protein [Allomuricauda ruestringensis]MCA0957690.1 hypothetical protein [Allomuricauda ruestringensis]
MMKLLKTIMTFILALLVFGCDEDDTNAPTLLEAGTLNGGPFAFAVDGEPDMVTGISLTGFSGSGEVQTYVITDDSKNILGLPPNLDALFDVDFDGAGVGACYIYHLTYNMGLSGLEVGENLDGLLGEFDTSNFLVVNRNALSAGELIGGPYDFVVDGLADRISDITLDMTNLNGANQTFIITDDSNNILGLPPTLEAVMGVDFDEAGTGKCYIYHLTYATGLEGLESGNNLNQLIGDFGLSNFLVVNRNALNAGSLVGGPYDFVVDGKPDMITGLMLDDMDLNGEQQTFVITDEDRNILGLPPSLDAVMGVDFDGAGTGICFVYHLTYSAAVSGLEAGGNLDDIEGVFDLSNAVTVNRNPLTAGLLTGGPYNFSVDGTPDMVSGLNLDTTSLTGSNQTFIVTDGDLNILGLPPTVEAVQGLDFDAAGIGLCLIWHLTYEDGIVGLEAGQNAADLQGFFALSEAVRVYRNPNAGIISGGPFTFIVDGNPDMVSGISLDSSGANGSNGTWIITDDQNNILGLPPSLTDVENVDFDGAGPGVCLIWYMRYEDGLTGLEPGNNISELMGLYGLSNSIQVTRN